MLSLSPISLTFTLNHTSRDRPERYYLPHWLQLKHHSRLEWAPGTWCDCGALPRDARHLKAGYWNGLFKQTLDNQYLQQLHLTDYHRKKALLTHISQQYTSVSAEPRLDLLFRCLYNREIVSQFLVNSIVKSEVFTSGSSMCPSVICPQNCSCFYGCGAKHMYCMFPQAVESCIIAQHSIVLMLEVTSDCWDHQKQMISLVQ